MTHRILGTLNTFSDSANHMSQSYWIKLFTKQSYISFIIDRDSTCQLTVSSDLDLIGNKYNFLHHVKCFHQSGLALDVDLSSYMSL